MDEYVRSAPPAERVRLEAIRRTIRAVAPDCTEAMSYGMPGYAYPGLARRGVFAWFALRNGYVGLYLRLPTIETHRRELARFRTTKSAVHLPLDQPLPLGLVAKLVRASLRATRRKRG